MELTDLANFLAILTIVEPSSKIAKYSARLAEAGTTTEGETDTSVLKELKQHLPELQKELDAINTKKLELKQKIVTQILTPDS